jgi:DNA ligase-1
VIKNAIDYIIPSEAIVEGEIVAVNTDTGELRPFQELMHRKRKYEVEKAMEMTPTMIFLFDILLLESDDLTQKPYSMRRNLLEKNVKESTSIKVMLRLMVSTSRELEIFMNQAISDGCEGLVVKDPNSTYRAGAREFSWIKLKREYRSELADTLNLVIIGAFYGKGKRTGKYGTYLLAAYDKEKDIFESISKVGTGFTDEDLEKFQVLLDQYKLSHKHSRVNSKINPDIWFLPQIVIEVAASEITLSPIYK